jgi:alanine racemase
MSRAAEAVIDLTALTANLERVRRQAPGQRIAAVIKANGYGHGMLRVARALQQADAFAVASIDEALDLRLAGIDKPIILLEGFFTVEELALIQRHRLTIVLHHEEQLRTLESLAVGPQLDAAIPLSVWLKLDTGMHRLGFPPSRTAALVERLCDCRLVERSSLVLMTHLANADDRRDPLTAQQADVFTDAVTRLDATMGAGCSVANSAGILGWPQTLSNGAGPSWVRPGIMLYGVSPFLDSSAAEHDLRPVMTLKSRLIAIQERQAGDAVGYGSSWRCPEDMRVGVVAIGYGDGYPRAAGNGTPVLLNGRRVPLAGRVSMDMLTVDLRGQDMASIGDEVILWGDGLPVEEIATCAGTIAYELLCRVTHRVRFNEYRPGGVE